MDKRHVRALIERLNPHCAKALEDAAAFAATRSHYEVGIEHVVIKLLEGEPGADIDQIFGHFKIDTDQFWRGMLENLSRHRSGNQGRPSISGLVFQWLERAWLASTLYYGEGSIRSGALLDALTDLAPALPVSGMQALDELPLDELRTHFARLVEGSVESAAAPSSMVPAPHAAGRDATATRSAGTTAAGGALDQFTTNLTAQAAAGELDPVRGRSLEIRQMIDILCRRRKNNPILVGDPGVGKTALVEGLALRIAAGEVPESLEGVTLRVLDLGLLQAGAGVKGEFERRLKQVIDEVKASSDPVITFIDEAHTLVGAGGEVGGSDAANLIKPALARGELRTIAATTWGEYKKYFERDAALERRFQMVRVEEPGTDAAMLMLNGLKDRYEEHHGTVITDAAVEAAVRLSERYISGRQLPDKAIDLLDTAAARIRMGRAVAPERLESLREHAEYVEQRLQSLARERAEGLDVDAEQEAALQGESTRAKTDLEALEARWSDAQSGEISDGSDDSLPLIHDAVTGEAVAEVVADWTGIPAGRMLRDEVATLMTLEERLAERVVGQDPALNAVAERLRNSKAGLSGENGPLGVFLLVGPSGVGKTETARAIAEELFGGERFLVTINMSEYQEAHTVSQLKGSPPGYVGYGEGGVLTEAVRQRPYCAVLLDEIEKGHPDVLNLFYQVFDRGVMRDGEGREIDFRNTVLLMTSNLGAEAIEALLEERLGEVQNADQSAAGSESDDTAGEEASSDEAAPQPLRYTELVDAARGALETRFAPALLGRLQIVAYLPLDLDAVARIVQLKLDALGARLSAGHGVEFRYQDAVVAYIAERCLYADTGARFVNALVEQQLLPAIARQLLQSIVDEDLPDIATLEIDDDGNLGCVFADRASPAAQQRIGAGNS